tara:strand:+ start:4383 stop:4589 length:207 start_codon:yes stop_codon:yes gene_type:complete
MKTTKRKKRSSAGRMGDALSRERSKRHGTAVKRGMKQAKEQKRQRAKAASVSRGKSKAAIAASLFRVS